MGWENITFVTLGFALYCLALILKSTSLRHLRFARIVDFAEIHRMPPRYVAWMHLGSLALSAILMGIALWQTINTDRSAFQWLASLGAMLVAIRLLGFFFTRVSLIALEIETDPASKLSLAHLRRSPFVLGGLALVIVGIAVPLALDGILQARLDSYRDKQWLALQDQIKREGFKQSYVPRSLRIENRAHDEIDFFSLKLIPRSRIIIKGRAGVGKSWFLMQLRAWFHDNRPGTAVIFLDAKDLQRREELQPGKKLQTPEDLLEHVSRTIFRGQAWGARPVTRKNLARALILIDGLDEVHLLNRERAIEEINEFANDKAFEQNIVVVTTRPTNLKGFSSRFEEADLPVLTASASCVALGTPNCPVKSFERKSPNRIAKLTAKLRELASRGRVVDERALRQFHTGPVPDWNHTNPEETARLYSEFLDSFGFSALEPGRAGGEPRMPFLSTYRDLDIVDALFLDALTGKLEPAPQTHAQMRTRLIEEYLRGRIRLNYKSGPSDPAFSKRVVDKLTDSCVGYLSQTPQVKTFTFDPKGWGFEDRIDGTTFETVVLESELLNEVAKPEGKRLVFDNPALDGYFLDRARRLAQSSTPGR